jgi:hypothetical protein
VKDKQSSSEGSLWDFKLFCTTNNKKCFFAFIKFPCISKLHTSVGKAPIACNTVRMNSKGRGICSTCREEHLLLLDQTMLNILSNYRKQFQHNIPIDSKLWPELLE